MLNNNQIKPNSYKNLELMSFYDPNSYSSSIYNEGINRRVSISSLSDDSLSDSLSDDDIVSSSYKNQQSRQSILYKLNNITTDNTSSIIKSDVSFKSNDIYERDNYISFIIQQNTYLNNTKYQKKFNELIFNFKL